jgi:hypothetical protein
MTDAALTITEPGAFQPMAQAQAPAPIDSEIRQFEFDWRRAQAFSRSRMVPAHFQGKAEDCMVAVMMARQLGVDPLLALQNVQVISGRPGFSASFAIGLANTRGPFNGPITWKVEGQGDDLQVTAMATVKATGEVVSTTVSMAMAKAEGWVKNPKYRSIPDQMLRYRAATWLIRLHCPEVLLGLSTADELVDIQPATVRVEPEDKAAPVVADLNRQIRRKASALPAQENTAEEAMEVATQPAAEPVEIVEPDDPF